MSHTMSISKKVLISVLINILYKSHFIKFLSGRLSISVIFLSCGLNGDGQLSVFQLYRLNKLYLVKNLKFIIN